MFRKWIFLFKSIGGLNSQNRRRLSSVNVALVIYVNRLTSFPRSTLAVKGSDSVVASSTVETGRAGAVVYIITAIGSRPTIDANAGVSAFGVGASGPVLANWRSHCAFIHVFAAIRSRVGRRTSASVTVNTIDASCPVLTKISWTIVYVRFAVGTRKA